MAPSVDVCTSRQELPVAKSSEALPAAHSRAGDDKSLYLDHPQLEGFEVGQTLEHGKAA
jgi:hypothetical protein